MSIDYRELLKKYIDHIKTCEGITFLDRTILGDFSQEELIELDKISNEDNLW